MKCLSLLLKPEYAPYAWMFPIVWKFFYIIMAVSLYLVWQAAKGDKQRAFVMFFIQLFFYFLWSPIFFGAELRFLALVVLALLWFSVILMIYAFYKVSKISAYFLIPYFIWITFTGILNYIFFVLNF
jgi:tryptophan-rich sensory protein